jgi:predicted acyltransferase
MNKTERILSVDIFRGIVISMMILVNYPGSWGYMYEPLTHSKWNGITPTDMIFPFFIFIVGVSIALSFSRQIESSVPRKEMVKKILIRGVKIYLLGLFLHYLPEFDFTRINLFGVLQRIAAVYTVSALLYIYTNWRTQIYLAASILLLYWITMLFIPTYEFSAGTMEQGANLAFYIDQIIFPVQMIGKHGWSAEGFYSTFPAICTAISGMLAGRVMLTKKITENTVIWMLLTGVLCMVAGLVWNCHFPINKKIWSSSFVLFTSGWAAIVLAATLFLVDLKGFKNTLLARFGIIFGSNAIAIYVVADLFETTYKYTHIHDFVYDGLTNNGLKEVNASLIWSLISVASCFLVGLILYRKKIFFKL